MLLVHGLGSDGLTAGGQDTRGQRAGGAHALGFAEHAGHAHHGPFRDVGAALGEHHELFEQGCSRTGVLHGPVQGHIHVTRRDAYGRIILFQQTQRGVRLPQGAQCGVPVGHVHHNTRVALVVLGLEFVPGYMISHWGPAYRSLCCRLITVSPRTHFWVRRHPCPWVCWSTGTHHGLSACPHRVRADINDGSTGMVNS